MGTAELSCESLRALTSEPAFNVAAVVTQPDQPKGRGLKLTASPVKEIALRENIAVLQPQRAREESFIEELSRLQPNLIVVAAYGQILPESVLRLPPLGCLNVHTSLLPKYRGAAPIQWALLNGDAETGVTIMKMDAGLDTGAIVSQESTPIAPEDNAQTLYDRLARLGANLLLKTIPDFAAGQMSPRSQPAEGVSYARKIQKSDGLIDWRRPARDLWNQVRALVPWPGAYCHLDAGNRPQLLKIWAAEPDPRAGEPGTVLAADRTGIVAGCGEGSLRILMLQREGGRRLNPSEFLAGFPLKPGQKLA